MSSQHPVDPSTVAFLRAAGCVYAEDEARILTEAAASSADLRAMLERRASGEPLEYIVGWAEFRGLRVIVRDGVFVPRRRSEFLAECAVQSAAAMRAFSPGRLTVLDMCCGTGALGLAVALEAGEVDLHAADSSPAAVACARENLARVGGGVWEGDLFEALPATLRGTVDLIVANAPYVPTAEIRSLPAEARLHEPSPTFDGGPDGTAVQARILADAPAWLRPGGCVLIETARDMSARTAGLAAEADLVAQIRESDDLDATVVIATRL